MKQQRGQSLIETIVAIFILTSSLIGGLGLTIYAFSGSTNSQNEFLASNLAREGVEVIRTIRDSSWLSGDKQGGAADLQTCADIGSKLCYPQAYSGINAGNQRIVFDTLTSSWALVSNPVNYNLYLQADGTYSSVTNGASVFGRMINISFNSNAPYTNQNSNQEMIVKSVVAWRGKGCTSFTSTDNLLTLSTPCKTVVEEHMTNWKDYK